MKNPFRNKRHSPDEVMAIWAAPATFNRKTRRSVGLLSRFWRWDFRGTEMDTSALPPRYVRRHFDQTPDNPKFTHPKTRRQRRHKARILKAMKGKLT